MIDDWEPVKFFVPNYWNPYSEIPNVDPARHSVVIKLLLISKIASSLDYRNFSFKYKYTFEFPTFFITDFYQKLCLFPEVFDNQFCTNCVLFCLTLKPESLKL